VQHLERSFVDPRKTARAASPLFPVLALILLGLHLLLLLAGSHLAASPFLGGLLQSVMGILAFGAAWQAAQRSEGFIRLFWRFQASSFFLWVLAQTLAAFYDGVLHKPIDQPWPSDLLFFLWTTPIFLSLFLDPYAESPRIEWPQWLDFAQVGILVASLYVFVFEVPSHWQSERLPVEKLALLVSIVRDLFLIACFAFRTLRARDPQVRSLYGRITIFLAVFSLAECPYLYLQVYERLRPGTFWDIPWSLALVLATALIVTSSPSAVENPWIWSQQRKPMHPVTRVLLKLVPLIFPMAVLLMAAHIAEQQFTIAVLAVLFSFGCSSARIVLADRQQFRSDEALKQRNALVKSVFEGTGDAIFVKDLQGRYLIVNAAVARFFGKSVEQVIGKTAFQVTDLKQAQELTANDRSILETGESVTVDFQTVQNDVTQHFLVTRSPYRDSSGKIIGIIGITRDITRYREIEDRLRQSQKMEAIGTLAGGVAHDFNNILMVISGYSSLLSEALRSDPKLRGHVEQIQKSGERAAALTRQLLAFSRKQTVQPTNLNLNEVVAGIENLLHRLIGENISISTQLDPRPGAIKADSGQLEQVILNLAVNARDAMPEGGKLSIETRRTKMLQSKLQGQIECKPGDYVELVVRDSGVGMDPATQSHIFEPFFTTKPPGKGTGLGLSTVYGIIQQAGGYVTFETAPGLGTSFHIYLPQVDAPASSVASEEDIATRLHGNETVLLVEDDASVCNLVRAVLTSHGYTVLAAQRPQEAITLCESQAGNIKLLLTDVIMPEMSGPELSKRLTAFSPQLRVLFMSGYIDDSVVRQEIQEQGIAYLQKPFSPTNLARKVREVLDSVVAR
jgi:PAS domain S-box-containing protein